MEPYDIFIIILCTTILIGVSALIIWYWNRVENTRKAKEEAEKEFINSTLCDICQKHSYGKDICKNCLERSDVLFLEIPNENLMSFDVTSDYYHAIKKKIIYAQSKHERETNSLRTLAVARYLKEKYCYKNALGETKQLLKDIRKNKYVINKEIENIYTDPNSEYTYYDNELDEEIEEVEETEEYEDYEETGSFKKANTTKQEIKIVHTEKREGCFGNAFGGTFGAGCGCVTFIFVVIAIAVFIIMSLMK